MISIARRRLVRLSLPARLFCTSDDDLLATPWVRQVVSGLDLMRNARYNKGFAFTNEERDKLHLRGLFPSAVNHQTLQVKCVMLNLARMKTNLEKNFYLMSVYERNERLFFRVLIENFEHLLPVVHNPTVVQACKEFPIMFRQVPKAMFISYRDRGSIRSILDNWPNRRVKLLVITDGANVGPLLLPGEPLDMGVESVGVPVAKSIMYTVCGGINPEGVMPVVFDVGTNNKTLLESPFYVGERTRRIDDDQYLELIDEFLTEVKRMYGNTVMIQFVDMKYERALKLVGVYRSTFPCMHDGSHGRAATILAGILSALPITQKKLSEHVIMLSGEGSLMSITAEMIATAVSMETGSTVLEVRKNIWMVDSNGLVVRGRQDDKTIAEHKLPFMHTTDHLPDLESSVAKIRPSILIGCSFTKSAPHKFTESICQSISESHERPIILPLSPAGTECSIQDLMKWTGERAISACREGFPEEAELQNGTVFTPRQCHTTYIFPGIALGTLMSRSNGLKFEQFIAAAQAVSKLVSKEDLQRGHIYPPLAAIREVAAHVAQSVAQKSYESGVATNLPKPKFLLDYARKCMFVPRYSTYS